MSRDLNFFWQNKKWKSSIRDRIFFYTRE